MSLFGHPFSRHIPKDKDIRRYIVYFAAEKLLGGVTFPHTTKDKLKVLTDGAKLACMAVRLALDFNATTLESKDLERRQVERCLSRREFRIRKCRDSRVFGAYSGRSCKQFDG